MKRITELSEWNVLQNSVNETYYRIEQTNVLENWTNDRIRELSKWTY